MMLSRHAGLCGMSRCDTCAACELASFGTRAKSQTQMTLFKCRMLTHPRRRRWASVKAFLGSWRRGPPPSEVPLPVDKLKCHLQPGGEGAVQQDPIEVLQ